MDEPTQSSTKKRGLGRGLDALLGATRHPLAETVQLGTDGQGTLPAEQISHLPIDRIQRGRYQPRRDFESNALRELADSIVAQGVIQPIVVRPIERDRYEIIAGERRWRASQLAGLTDIPVVIREVDEASAVSIGLIENIQRADLNPLEEAAALERLLVEFQLTHQQIAEAVGKSRTTITNLLRLLDLNPDVKRYVEQSQLEMGHARALLGLKGQQQSIAARQVVKAGLSVRETERLVRKLQQTDEPESEQTSKEETDPNIRELQNNLAERLGARVEIHQGVRGSGKLVIAYNSLDELDGIMAHIK
jgi:ParB family chromosome partitioning protein